MSGFREIKLDGHSLLEPEVCCGDPDAQRRNGKEPRSKNRNAGNICSYGWEGIGGVGWGGWALPPKEEKRIEEVGISKNRGLPGLSTQRDSRKKTDGKGNRWRES